MDNSKNFSQSWRKKTGVYDYYSWTCTKCGTLLNIHEAWSDFNNGRKGMILCPDCYIEDNPEEKYRYKFDNLLSRFSEGALELYKNDVYFHTVINILIAGGDVYKVLEETIKSRKELLDRLVDVEITRPRIFHINTSDDTN